MTSPARWLITANVALAAALALQLPAELIRPLVKVGPIGVSNIEATGYLLVAAWVPAVIVGVLPRVRLPIWVIASLAVIVVGAILSSAYALFDQGAAVKAALRIAGALVVGTAAASIILSSPARWRIIASAGLAGAAASALLGIAEFAVGWDGLRWLFGQFREAPISLGGFATRATGTLLHPNVAAWYWGSVGVAALAGAVLLRGRRRLALLIIGAVLMLATVLTLSRGGLIGVSLGSLVAAFLLWQFGSLRASTAIAAVVLPLSVIAIGASLASPLVSTRLISETDIEWYEFRIDAPSRIASEDGTDRVQITVTNLGPIGWPDEGNGEVVVSYHLKGLDGRNLDYVGAITPLPRDVGPGESVEVNAAIEVESTAAEAVIEWDLLQIGGSWFSQRLPANLSTSRIHIANPRQQTDRGSVDLPPSRDDVELRVSQAFGRRLLWPIAFEMIAARPLIGIGLDNYRHGYGEWRGLSRWDDTVNTNNLYLELFVGMGVFAVVMFGLALAAAARLAHRARAVLAGPALPWLVALVAFGAHGMLDAFLLYSTALYFVGTVIAGGLIQANYGGEPPA